MRWLFAIGLLVLSAALVSCTPQGYQRGTTSYQAGKAEVKDPNLKVTNRASFDGIRVRGYDTDVYENYWDQQLQLLGNQKTFEMFRRRHKDLIAYQTNAAKAALKSFQAFCFARKIHNEFMAYWRICCSGS